MEKLLILNISLVVPNSNSVAILVQEKKSFTLLVCMLRSDFAVYSSYLHKEVMPGSSVLIICCRLCFNVCSIQIRFMSLMFFFCRVDGLLNSSALIRSYYD